MEVLETIHQLSQHAHQQAQERLAAGSAAAAGASRSPPGASETPIHPAVQRKGDLMLCVTNKHSPYLLVQGVVQC